MFAAICTKDSTAILLTRLRVIKSAHPAAQIPFRRAKHAFAKIFGLSNPIIPKMKPCEANRQNTAVRNRVVERLGSVFQYSTFVAQLNATSPIQT
jgi:hypothetical protein